MTIAIARVPSRTHSREWTEPPARVIIREAMDKPEVRSAIVDVAD